MQIVFEFLFLNTDNLLVSMHTTTQQKGAKVERQFQTIFFLKFKLISVPVHLFEH